MALKVILLWIWGGEDHPMWSLYLVLYSSYDLGCVAYVMSMWMVLLSWCICAAYYEGLIMFNVK